MPGMIDFHDPACRGECQENYMNEANLVLLQQHIQRQ